MSEEHDYVVRDDEVGGMHYITLKTFIDLFLAPKGCEEINAEAER
jgi:hypothetical protein